MGTKMVELNIEGHKLAWICLNPGAAGEPIILIHGITGSIAAWEVNPLPFVLEQGPCYSLSLPGHFPAAFPADFKQDQLTAGIMARVMADAIRQIAGDHPVTLMGHSTGGFASLNIAAHYPQMARRVVSVSGFAHGRWIGFLGFYQRLVRTGAAGKALFKSLYRLAGANPIMFRAILRIYAADVKALYANPDINEVVERTLPNFQKLDLDSMTQYFSVMPEVDITSMLPQIQCPTLAISGDSDPTVPADESRKLSNLRDGR